VGPAPGGVLGLLTILAGLGSPAVFVVMMQRTVAGFRSGEIRYRGKIDRKSESAFDYWSSMFVSCLATITAGVITLVFLSLSLVLITQMFGR